MCGICGLCAPSAPLENGDARISAMLSSIWHRGPDAQGSHVEEHVALGNQRLAIIDLAGGDQPIYNEDRSVCAVYNGEIYNYPELAAWLRGRGHELASQSDSEILVHLYEERGIDFIADLNGMFAFALWDVRAAVLYLARDRFGVKPLHYHWDGRTLSFGSEVKALLRSGSVEAALDADAFVELLTFQNILSERSLFAGVQMLAAGSVLRLDERGPQESRYWDFLPQAESRSSEADLAGAIRERFDTAVERQLMSDVEIASYLSGGLDTGAITAAAGLRLDRLTTFCTGFDTSDAAGMEADFDERADAAELARIIGTHHHELLLRAPDMELVLPRLVRHIEEPRMSFSYPNYLTAGVASRWVKVVLSGAGGDELFGGYPWRYEFAGEPDFAERYFGYWTRLLSSAELAGGLSAGFAADADLERPRRVFDEIIGRADGLPDLDRALYFESKTFLHGLLVIEDKLSMAHSLESRVPFLDNDLVDLTLSIPANRKLDGARSKDLFRRAMAGRLPEQVISRRKTGFTPPQAAWFRGSQGDYVEQILLSERACDRGLFRVDFVKRLLDEHRAGEVDRRLVLWTLTCMEWWHRIFLDGEHAT
ncbi:MAG TPA: asparagine synthase (glutamine-hydrolyzing) [Solirubrobacteraceae bacterium]|nr:asparagine synthase (glutamine-hydrolyzing) [Solirubrobacteraceae bacterium]